MKLGIDISQIVYEGTGVARFTDGLARAILEYDRKNQWCFFFSSLRKKLDENLEKEIIRKSHKLIKWKLPPTILSFLWNDLHNFSQLLTINCSLLTALDWFITSDWAEPLISNAKKATVIHDLSYLRHPETVDTKIRNTQKKRLQWVKKESQIIFVDSETTKEDCGELLRIENKRLAVNYPGVRVAKMSKNNIHHALKKYHLENKKFILTVGKLEPRKNLNRLLEAFKLLKSEKLQLIVVGPKGWGESSIIHYLSSNIKFLGYIPDDDLYSLYSSCLFFVFPSIWEGFGYPIIEAMKCRAPVACSNTSSIKEIAGDAALFFDPFDILNMYQSIKRLIQDGKLRKELVKKGIEKSKLFTWESYYNKLIKTFEQYR